jgi:hypothetical protein
MRILLILGLCATAMVANAQTAKRDTVTRVVLNHKVYKNFDGSLLTDKTIASYNMDTITPPSREECLQANNLRMLHAINMNLSKGYFIDTLAYQNTPVIILHKIKTTDAPVPEPQPISIQQPDGVGAPLMIVDGVESSAPPMNSDIIEIRVYDPNMEEAKEYGEKGKNGVIVITTKKKFKIIYIIDGKVSTEAEMEALSHSQIESMTVLKGKALKEFSKDTQVKEYTKDPNAHVYVITTKKKK